MIVCEIEKTAQRLEALALASEAAGDERRVGRLQALAEVLRAGGDGGEWDVINEELERNPNPPRRRIEDVPLTYSEHECARRIWRANGIEPPTDLPTDTLADVANRFLLWERRCGAYQGTTAFARLKRDQFQSALLTVREAGLRFADAVDEEQMRRHDGMVGWQTKDRLYKAVIAALAEFRAALAETSGDQA